MDTITISVDEKQLRQKASELGLTVEAVVLLGVEALLSGLDEDFEQATAYILKKNEELYRRLT
jgi:hypothetical protein